ncbi:MAG: FtsW/RodA/SpoVE family cell cycle protein, partial [Planctomycetales bacterium]|nr:FtsW/RodA/SpoVE family cell cycle protein [Planctomycetales bacterium]
WLAGRRPGLVGLVPIGLAAGLVAVEPDIGTASATAAVGLVCLYVGGVRLRDLALAAAVCGPLAAVAAYRSFDHVRARIASFTGAGDSHQLRQSLLALGAGGWAGVGLGAGRQKLLFLPEESSDFILAEVGEELGLLGTAGVLALFGLLLLHGTSVALRARDPFGAVVAAGMTLSLTLQAAVNAAVVTGCVPTKGIALPFVSAGGSCVVASCIAAAAIAAVARDSVGGGRLDAATRGRGDAAKESPPAAMDEPSRALAEVPA